MTNPPTTLSGKHGSCKSPHNPISCYDRIYHHPRSIALLVTLFCTCVYNVLATLHALRTETLTYPHYMISHAIVDPDLRLPTVLVWGLCALVCLTCDVVIVRHWTGGSHAMVGGPAGRRVARYGWLSLVPTALACAGWVGCSLYDINEHLFVHTTAAALYGSCFLIRAAIHVWLIEPLREKSGLPVVPLLRRFRVTTFYTELLAAPVLFAGLPILLRKRSETLAAHDYHGVLEGILRSRKSSKRYLENLLW